ncbi:MAG TPA: NPCBM/NEW2 domain-containing protein, partial [Pirellulales bacterium]
VRSFQGGKHAAESQKVLNELSAARLCLLSADKKAPYDQTLKAKLAPPQAPAGSPQAKAAAKPVATPINPLRVAQAAPLRPTPVATPPEDLLGIDPLASSTAPRHRKRRPTSQQPALLVGVGAALVAVIGLVWALAGNSDGPPAQLTSKPSAADDHKVNGPDRTDDSKPPADHAPNPKRVDPLAADVSKPAELAPADSADDSAEKPSDEPSDNVDTATDSADSPDEVMDPAMPEDSGDADPASAEPDDAPAKAPVPDADALKAAIAEIQSLLKADFSAAKKPDQRIALAEKLLGLAKDSDAPTERYALLSEAQRLAASAGDAGLAMQAIGAQAEEFAVQRLELAADMLDSLASKELPAAARKELVEAILPLIDEAAAASQFKLARRLAAIGLAVARKASATDAAKTLARQSHDLAAQEKLAEAADAARKQLAEKPDDAEAHLTLGKYLCLVAGDWDAGLPHLKQGSDPALRSIAERELAGAETPADQVKLGDQSWDLADEQKGVEKDRYRSRAGYWYEQAIGELSGLSKAKVEKRLADLPAAPAAAPPVASRGGVIADKVVLWNTHDNDWNDRGMLSCNVELRKAGKVVWSQKAVSVAWKTNEDLATTVLLPKIAFDALRVETVSFQGLGAGLCEIEVFRGKTNLARGKPVIASSSHNASPPPDAVVDGIRDSSRRLLGYWVALDRQLAWIELQIVPPVASNKDSVNLADLPAHDIRVYQYDGQGLKVGGVSLRGVVSPHGVQLHPTSNNSSHVAFDLDGRYQTLAGKAGINDTANNFTPTALTFRIVGDGREIWKSQPLQKTGESQDFEVNVARVRQLELFVDCPGWDAAAHAVWFEPKLTKAAGVGHTPPSNVSKSVAVGKSIDLLPLVDLEKQHIETVCQRTADGLRISRNNTSIHLPVQLEGDYSLHVEFTRISGNENVVVVLPVAVGHFMLALSAFGGEVSGLDVVNGQGVREHPASIRPGTLENGRRYRLDVAVRQTKGKLSIESKLDGKPFVNWSGDLNSASIHSNWSSTRHDRVSLGANEPTIFHVARLKMLSGKATIDADAARKTSTPLPVSKSVTVGKWIDLLPLADPVRQHLEPDWRRTAAGLHVEKREGKLPIPMSVDGEYSLHVEFTRKSGRDTVVVILPIASGQCMLALSGHDGAVTGFEVINGQE